MDKVFTPATFRKFCETRAVRADPLLAAYVGWYGLTIFGVAKAKFGNSAQLQPELAPSTQDDRVTRGFSADETLLRSGSLKDSLEFEHWGLTAGIGTEKMEMLWAEVGTVTQPPRPLLRLSAQEIALPAWLTLRRYTAQILGIGSGVPGDAVGWDKAGFGNVESMSINPVGLSSLSNVALASSNLMGLL